MKSKDQPQTKSNYGTSNIYEAAFLLAKGFSLCNKINNEGKITVFFENEEESKKAGLEFYNDATIEARKFADSFRTIKDYIFDGNR